MINKLFQNFLIFSFLLLALRFNTCLFLNVSFKEDPQGCSLEKNLTTGTFRISSEIKSNANCDLTIYNLASTPTPLVLFIESVILAENDLVQVFQDSPHKKLIANVSSSGFLFLKPSPETTIKLNTSASVSNRVLALSYSYDSNLNLILTQTTRLTTLPYTVPEFEQPLSLTLNLLAPKLSSTADDKKIVAMVNHVSDDTNVKFDGKDYKNVSDHLSVNSKLAVTLTMKKLSEKPFDILFNLVNGKCSEMKQLDNVSSSFSIDLSGAQKSEEELKCLWIVSLKDNDEKATLNLNYENPLFNNDLETYVIRNGSLSTSPVLTTLVKSNVEQVKNSLVNSILSAKSLHITFSGFYPKPSSVQGYFTVTRNENSGLYKSHADLNFTPNEKEKGSIILFMSTLEQALLKVSTQTLKNATLTIYSSLDAKNEDLLATFQPTDVIPSVMWSPTKFMALKFSSLEPFVGTLSSSKMTKNVVASGAQSSYLLQSTDLDCGESVEWLIPINGKGKGDINSLVISSLMLEDKSSLKIVNVTDKSTIFELTGQSDSHLQTLPTLLLENSTSHSVIYTRGSATTCDTTPHTLLQSTVGLIHYDECKRIYELTPLKNLTISSVNYPNNYSLLEPSLTQQCNSIKSNTTLLYWSFNEFDLAYDLGHFLSIEGSNVSLIKLSKGLPDDFISSSPVALNFNRPLSSKTLSKTAKLSGKGFKANVEAITCGQSMVNEPPHSLFLNSTQLSNHSKCIYIIKSPKKEQVITLKMDPVPANLLIYDTNSLRSPRLLNMSYLSNQTISSSSDTLILTYMVDHKTDYNISISYSDCPERCLNNLCMNQLWKCNGVNDCGDLTDETRCNGTVPLPQPPPAKYYGVNGWVIVFVIIPLSMVVGAILALFGPRIIGKFRGGHYQEFRDYSDVS